MSGENRFLYTNLGLPSDLVKLIDDYRFGRRIGTRSKAIRELLEIALVHQGVIPPADSNVVIDPPFRNAVPIVVDGHLAGWTGEL
jgi:hypothetical protein